ncbi:MAG: cytochrome c biogenesis protein ResB, partial [Candidatus Omnitrophota bacterium]|nr:cytochrome c biogenesis protein ResB [Candidatus Omnitrophota bacterium]
MPKTPPIPLMIRRIASVRITVVCLFLLFVLTLWGTVAQMTQGLYGAQHRFFYSLGFLALGFIPFPGARLVLWVMFINLACATVTRFSRPQFPRDLGLLVIHGGLLLYFVAAFATFHLTRESNLHLLEGEGANISSSYHDWEISFWTDDAEKRRVIALDTQNIAQGQTVAIPQLSLALTIKTYYPNSQAYTMVQPGQPAGSARNASGILSLTSVPWNKEPEKNIPGIIINLKQGSADLGDVLLYGGEDRATKIERPEGPVHVQLRPMKSPMPFTLFLKDFKMEKHPNTEVARSYQSLVEIKTQGLAREILISMNKPLRYKDYTLYQASYSIDSLGREYSTLAVVK